LEYTNLVDRYFAHMRERNPTAWRIFLRTMQRSSYRMAVNCPVSPPFMRCTSSSSPQCRRLPLAAVIAGAHGVATEIEARLPDGTVRRTANFFHFNGEGLIERLSVYARGR